MRKRGSPPRDQQEEEDRSSGNFGGRGREDEVRAL